jgi:hypothetical protein
MNDAVVRAERECCTRGVRRQGDPSPTCPAFYGPDRVVVTAGPEKDARSNSSATRLAATAWWIRVAEPPRVEPTSMSRASR